MRHLLATLALLALLAAGAAHAQRGFGVDIRSPCAQDRQRFCAGETSRAGADLCLTERIDQISLACRNAIEGRAKRSPHAGGEPKGGLQVRCREDLASLCGTANETLTHEQKRRCLVDHSTALLEDCRAALVDSIEKKPLRTGERGAAVGIRKACAETFAAHCPDAPDRNARIACAQTHESELSDPCRASLARATGEPIASP